MPRGMPSVSAISVWLSDVVLEDEDRPLIERQLTEGTFDSV